MKLFIFACAVIFGIVGPALFADIPEWNRLDKLKKKDKQDNSPESA